MTFYTIQSLPSIFWDKIPTGKQKRADMKEQMTFGFKFLDKKNLYILFFRLKKSMNDKPLSQICIASFKIRKLYTSSLLDGNENMKKVLLLCCKLPTCVTMQSPCWSLLDFWKIKLEKSTSINCNFSLFQTGFLLQAKG